ncbi:TRAP transporter substrate-binding protein [Ruegeria sp.]|uniref:TRAP transporter substrate-binding protein n=1 Tax=Ruegeria sp. TaxID=1879320 RepID=UPI003C7AFF22
MKHFKAALTASATLMAIACGAAYAETVIRVESFLSPQHPQNAVVLPTWAKNVEEFSEGRLKVDISYPPNVHPKTFFDRAKSGISDVTWSFHGYTPGKFVLTRLVELPGAEASAYEASVAYQKIHEQYLDSAGEHDGVKLLSVFSHGPGVLHTREPISSIEQLDGLKVRVGGGVGGEVAKNLGIVTVAAPATKVYEFASQGVVDGILMPMETKKSLKLSEVAPHSLMLPGGFYFGSFFMVMNQAKYDGLSDEDKAAIDKASGLALAELAGRAWAEGDQAGHDYAIAEGNTLTVANADLNAEIQAQVASVEAAWIEAANTKGLDAEAVLAAYRDEVAKLAGE